MSHWTDETAEWYAVTYGEYATNRIAVDAIEVAKDAVIVDIGCGTGFALRTIAPRVLHGRLIGVDPTPRMLEFAKQRASEDPNGGRIEFLEAAAEKLPFDDDFADTIFAFDSIDHWNDRALGLREVLRVLRSDGQFIIVKDGSLSDSEKNKQAFRTELSRAGFTVTLEKTLAEGDVTATIWVCRIT